MSKFSYKEQKTAELEKNIAESLKKQTQPMQTDPPHPGTATMSEAELFSFADHDTKDSERIGYSEYSYWRSTLRTFLHNKIAVTLLIVMCALILFTFIQPLLPGQSDPNYLYFTETGSAMSNRPPSAQFWFGTNNAGQDLWSRIWAGTRTSLFIGFIVALVQAAVGITIGVLWGYVRKLDFFFTELYNIFDNIPSTIVLILLSYIMKRSTFTLIFAMSITGWLGMARFIRNQILMIRDRDYNLASRCLGTPLYRIVFKNLLPYLVSVIMLRMALTIPGAIGSEVFITYIGLGLPVETPSLGNLVNTGRQLMTSPELQYQLLFPTLVLSIITISFYVIGNAFSDAADPKNHR